MPIERRAGYRLWVGGPVPRGSDGITLGSLVIMRKGCARPERLLAHELAHVRQFARLGWVRFLSQYLGSYVSSRLKGRSHREAYLNIPLEIDARWQEACDAAVRAGHPMPPRPPELG